MGRTTPSAGRSFVVCVNTGGYQASLELHKVYLVLPDPAAGKRGLIRVVDESGEDYLFPSECYEAIEHSESAASAIAADS